MTSKNVAAGERILVLGGTGMLGQPTVRRLLAGGFRVRVLSRSPERARALLGDDCEIVQGDVEDLSELDAALRGCQGVHLSLHGEREPDLERRAALSVARLAGAAGVRRVSYLSGASVFEENCWFRDTKARFEAEAALRTSGVPFTIVEVNFVMESLRKFVRGPVAIVPGRQPNRYHWVAADDLARMVSRAYALPEAANKSLFVYGPEAYTMREALEVYCPIVHPRARIVQPPLWLLSLYAWLGRRRALKDVLPFFRYLQRVGPGGNPAEANALLGAPTIRLEQSCREQAVGMTEPREKAACGAAE